MYRLYINGVYAGEFETIGAISAYLIRNDVDQTLNSVEIRRKSTYD